jgi:hypothetical protein
MGLGQQGGSHAEVSVIVPFGAGTVVDTFIVKASQGNSDTTGQARVIHDSVPFSEEGEPLSDWCDLPLTPDVTICFDDGVGGSLINLDSLSVFIETDGGNFEGATACVLIGPIVDASPPVFD